MDLAAHSILVNFEIGIRSNTNDISIMVAFKRGCLLSAIVKMKGNYRRIEMQRQRVDPRVFTEAVKNDKYDYILAQLNSPNFNVNTRIYANNHAALSYAVMQNKPELVKVFLRMGANPNIVMNNTCSMLQYAVLAGFHDVVRELLADPRTKDFYNGFAQADGSALDIARRNDDQIMVDLLLKHGADPDAKSSVKSMRKKRDDINEIKQYSQKYPLMVIKDYDNKDAIIKAVAIKDAQKLLDVVDVAVYDDNYVLYDNDLGENIAKHSAIEIACEKGDLQCVKILLALGSDYLYQGDYGTAIELARNNGHEEVVKYIENLKKEEAVIFQQFIDAKNALRNALKILSDEKITDKSAAVLELSKVRDEYFYIIHNHIDKLFDAESDAKEGLSKLLEALLVYGAKNSPIPKSAIADVLGHLGYKLQEHFMQEKAYAAQALECLLSKNISEEMEQSYFQDFSQQISAMRNGAVVEAKNIQELKEKYPKEVQSFIKNLNEIQRDTQGVKLSLICILMKANRTDDDLKVLKYNLSNLIANKLGDQKVEKFDIADFASKYPDQIASIVKDLEETFADITGEKLNIGDLLKSVIIPPKPEPGPKVDWVHPKESPPEQQQEEQKRPQE